MDSQIIMLLVCGSQLRLMQAHFDGKKLVVRFSPLQDFSHVSDMTATKMLLLVRCLVGHPMGITAMTFLPLTIDISLPNQIES
jgi:hypothetical protein